MSARRPRPHVRFQATLRRWQGSLQKPGSLTEHIHAARVALKEARALLRLLRATLPESTVEAWESRLRATMKSLAPARDRTIVLAVVTAQLDVLPPAIDREALLRAMPRPRNPHPTTLRRLPRLLEAFEQALLPTVREGTWDPIDHAFSRSQRRVRRLQSKARHSRSPDHWHRWRRRVKAFAYQADFVRPPGLPDWKSLRQHAWRLQSLLGDLQDIHVTLDHLADLDAPASSLKTLRAELRRAATKARKKAWQARIPKSLL